MLDPRNDESTYVTDNDYKGFNGLNLGHKARKTAQNYENYKVFNGGGVQFRPNEQLEDESGVCSPPLWRTSPPHSPAQAQARQNNNNYRYLSPTSRTQAIARGQWELMEMVKNMPESSYELSLKDLVEHNNNRSIEQDYSKEESLDDGKKGGYQRVKSKGKEKEKKVKIIRSGSMDHNKGLFIHMVFPVSFRSKKKKHLGTNAFAKVSPKPEVLEKITKGGGGGGGGGGGEKDWWKKRFSTSCDSESGITSSNSTGSSGSSGSSSRGSRNNSTRKKKDGCLLSIFSKKRRPAK